MSGMGMHRRALFFCLGLASAALANASKLVEVQTIDEQTLMLRFQDAWVFHDEDGKGKGALQGHESMPRDRIEVYGKPLDVSMAAYAGNYLLSSRNDPKLKIRISPANAYRKTKVSGTAWKWPDPELTLEHTIFLRLSWPLKEGGEYELDVNEATESDLTKVKFSYHQRTNPTEAIHVNLIGFEAGQTASKTADLYQWMGDGGARDYSAFIGKQAYLVDDKGKATPVGKVQFWKKSGTDCGNWNFTQSDVWTVDFSTFNIPGKYRLSIDGAGASAQFEIKNKAYFEPFKTSLRGYYYMRIGEPPTMNPPARQPQFIPGKDVTVYLTTMSPWHPDWKKLPGDPWDVKDWSKYKVPGSLTNPNAYGGHSDALDWDRHLGHISSIWDILLPYIISNGKGGEDNLGIRESGNGIPDCIDEAQNEVDFWLRLRDEKGNYATGLNNPSEDHKTLYQGAAHPYMAWANAANAAILADAYRVAKKQAMVEKYTKAALEAWAIGEKTGGEDASYDIGNGRARGKDHKLLAAACLYSVTGDPKFEKFVTELSEIKSPIDQTEDMGKYNQVYGTAIYLSTGTWKVRAISNEKLFSNMRASLIAEAIKKNVENSEKWPSRRASDPASGWFQSIVEVQKVCIAHAFAPDAATQQRLLKALYLEADWGLGRNPMNMVQMTGLGSRRPDYIYTSGRNDGVPECHPGHTPYMNSEPWGNDFMGNPRYYSSRGYPDWKQWPQAEALWRAPYCYSNNEFTPQQSMRGKHMLYAYLYTLGK